MTKMTNREIQTTELAIIGAGPIGIELAIALKRAGVDYLHFDARQIGDTISRWPRQTHFFSTTERIELAGMPIPNTHQGRITGEEYLAYLRSIIEQLDLQIRTYEAVIDLRPEQQGFVLKTRTAEREHYYQAKKVVIATGDMQHPNRLSIPGEDLPHVDHYFTEPHRYFRQRLLIVGGRNSAAEAALRCWRAGAQVTISYRRAEFDPKSVKHFVLPDLQAQIELGTIQFLPETQPLEITPKTVVMRTSGSSKFEQPADFVLLLTGYIGDMRLFEQVGVSLIGPERAPKYHPDTMETDVPGIYVAGTAAGGERKIRYSYFIENCHIHVARIVHHLTGQWPVVGTIPARSYEQPLEDIQAN